MLKHRDPAHFHDWLNPGRNKFIPGTARNCPGVVTPLHGRWIKGQLKLQHAIMGAIHGPLAEADPRLRHVPRSPSCQGTREIAS